MFIYSCSNDNDNEYVESNEIENRTTSNTKQYPPIENDIDRLFYEYVTSDIYQEVKQELNQFILDLNYKDSDFNNIDTEEKLFNWIDGNIQLTNFKTKLDAITRWNNIKRLKGIELSSFPEVYEYITINKGDKVVKMIDKWLTKNIMVSPGQFCNDELKSCTMHAAGIYMDDIDYALSLEQEVRANAIASADLSYQWHINMCGLNYQSCIENFT